MPNPNFPNNPGYNLYVGARYVPVFANPSQWNNANSYEPLTIVTNEGNSYTSKTFVPAGTDISNEEYWALTGNYNAQVEQYRSEVMNYAQQSQMYFNYSTNLSQRLLGKSILIIGASNEILEVSGYGPTWTSYFKTMVENFGGSVTVIATADGKLTGATGGAVNFVNKINNYDIVIVTNHRNDWYANVPISNGIDTSGYDTINSALYYMYANGIVNNSAYNKEVYFLGMFKGVQLEDYSDIKSSQYQYTWASYATTIATKCARYGFHYIDAYSFAGSYAPNQNSVVAPDGRHFVSPYTQRIAENVFYAVLTGRYDMPNLTSQLTLDNLTETDYISFPTNGYLKQTPYSTDIYIIAQAKQTMSANTTYNVMTLPLWLAVVAPLSVGGMLRGRVSLQSGSTKTGDASFQYQGAFPNVQLFLNTPFDIASGTNIIITASGSISSLINGDNTV